MHREVISYLRADSARFAVDIGATSGALQTNLERFCNIFFAIAVSNSIVLSRTVCEPSTLICTNAGDRVVNRNSCIINVWISVISVEDAMKGIRTFT